MFMKELNHISGVDITPEMLKNSIYNSGNPAMLAKVFQKARRGEEIVVCAFGGSITEGAGVNDELPPDCGIECTLPRRCYFDVLCDSLEEDFGFKIKRVNAGISATDTVFGIHRMSDDVLIYEPDLVILEWCCNDDISFPHKQVTYENMVRTFLLKGVAVILFSMATRGGISSQSLHEPIADYYDIPLISYRDAYFSCEKFAHFTTDSVHPNRVGCILAALILKNFICRIYQLPDTADMDSPAIPSEPMNSEAGVYVNPCVANLKDIYDGKYDGIRITDLGAFSVDDEKKSFAYRSYHGFSAYSKDDTSPMVIEIDKCKTLYLLVYRNAIFRGVDFDIELNGTVIKDESFTSRHGTDNSQTEWDYHWATERIYLGNEPGRVVLRIHPRVSSENQCVKLFSLLLS